MTSRTTALWTPLRGGTQVVSAAKTVAAGTSHLSAGPGSYGERRKAGKHAGKTGHPLFATSSALASPFVPFSSDPVTREVKRVVGDDHIDIEIWNELTFGSDFPSAQGVLPHQNDTYRALADTCSVSI